MGAIVSANADGALPVATEAPEQRSPREAKATLDAAGDLTSGRVQNGEGGPMAAEQPNTDQWLRIQKRLRAELGEDVFGSWFGRVTFEEANGNSVHLSVPTRFLKSWIAAHYGERLLKLWQSEIKGIGRVELTVRGAVRGKVPVRAEKPAAAAPTRAKPPAVPASGPEPAGALSGSPVEPRYSFETFCEGAANRVAFAAAQAVAENTAGRPTQFNPLYIHAGVGRGKQHLVRLENAVKGAVSGHGYIQLVKFAVI